MNTASKPNTRAASVRVLTLTQSA